MKLQRVTLLILSIVCLGVLIVSASVWKNNIREAGEAPGIVPSENGDKTIAEVRFDADKLQALGASLDQRTLDVLVARVSKGEDVQMLVIGSASMRPAAERFASSIEKQYEQFIGIDIATFDLTSTEFVQNELESGTIDWAKGYDIVLYEPFTLNNNGIVVIEDERRDLLAVKTYAESFVDDVSFLVTPSHPLYKPRFYLTQISELEQFTAEQSIPYINHWTNWPDYQTDAILPYLDDKGVPTELGVEAWAEGLINYFIAES